ncbi:hypothetical protein FPRO04_14569 [Fusarium proliferatum]|nr:hypothetical protein FPRO04_14569 [Fusarium proliferatum]
MHFSSYIAGLVAGGALAVPHNGNLQNGNKHYQIVTKFEYVTHYVIGGANDNPRTTCVSNAQKLPDVSDATTIYAHPTDVQPVKSQKLATSQHYVSSSGPSYGLSADQREAIDLHNKARRSVGNGPIYWDTFLAVGAQQWANHIASIGFLQHSKGDYGENLYMGTTNSPYSISTKAFISEESQYNGEAISASNYLDFGHYT